MQRKQIRLSKGTVLWEAGDIARNIAIVQTGMLGVRTQTGLVGVALPQMVLGESALFVGEAELQRRTATVIALADDTDILEYPAEVVQTLLESNEDTLAQQVLKTLVGQICRNLLMVIAAKRGYSYIDSPLTALVQSVVQDSQKSPTLNTWEAFSLTGRFLLDLRDLSDSLLTRLGPDASLRGEMVESASQLLMQLFSGLDM
ncbi:MAG: cyclic nucleotide-binding domain-containing protein, partial [Vicinamibacteria bacterium]|nr:cyclic nucleotide-binding domain-containing protein [Vicinamibacteria bacterium]